MHTPTEQTTEVNQYFCPSCGETTTYLVSNPQIKRLNSGGITCRSCLHGIMTPVVINFTNRTFEAKAQ